MLYIYLEYYSVESRTGLQRRVIVMAQIKEPMQLHASVEKVQGHPMSNNLIVP
jgi:hypothetical protein